MKPRISILLPARDAAQTLREALDSIQTQTLNDWELIAVDDGSRDATPAILREYAAQDPRVRIERLDQPHGIPAALNRSAELARGKLLARMDADDFSLPQRLELQAELLDARPDLHVASCLVAPHPDGQQSNGLKAYLRWVNGLTEHESMARERFIESPLPHPSVTLRREALAQAGGYRESGWPEDYDLWLRMFAAGMRFAKVKRELLLWRDAPARASRAQPAYSIEAFLRCKVHYIARGPLAQASEFFLWGAGRYAKQTLRCLLQENQRPQALVDVNPDKIGRSVPNQPGGVPVIAPDALPDAAPQRMILAAVGARGSQRARNEIRQALAQKGYCEGKNFWCLT
ncbi:glycosyltransferase [Candidatus Sumerlaeota bacterium]|nr:glycosyltransferase [Candidatus Sumerlaeota bacterium]